MLFFFRTQSICELVKKAQTPNIRFWFHSMMNTLWWVNLYIKHSVVLSLNIINHFTNSTLPEPMNGESSLHIVNSKEYKAVCNSVYLKIYDINHRNGTFVSFVLSDFPWFAIRPMACTLFRFSSLSLCFILFFHIYLQSFTKSREQHWINQWIQWIKWYADIV